MIGQSSDVVNDDTIENSDNSHQICNGSAADADEWPPSLHPDHKADLIKSGLYPTSVQALGIHTVPSGEIAQHLGLHDARITSVLCFPYPGENGFCRDKIWPTDLTDAQSHAFRYTQPKKQPGEVGCRLYIPPLARDGLQNPKIDLRFTEGEKKAAKACQERYACIGLGGLWNSLPEKALLPQFDDIALQGRLVFLVLDRAIWTSRKDLLLAVYRFGKLLKARGALVVVELLPGHFELDDFLVAAGAQAFIALEPLPKIFLSDKRFHDVAESEERRKEKKQDTPEGTEIPITPDMTAAMDAAPAAIRSRAALSPTGQAALAYTDAGYFVVPLCWPDENGACGCPKGHTNLKEIGKAPLLGIGYQDMRLTRAQVIDWWLRYPSANVGILLEPGGLLVVDSDSEEADREVETLGVPPGPRAKTPRGIHRFFRNESGIKGLTTHEGASGKIDVISRGYVVAPPSRRPNGGYTWELTLSDTELEDAPTWVVKLLAAQKTQPPPITVIGDLAPVELTSLDLEPWLLEVITKGHTSHPDKYPSRSEALFAVEMGLLRAGCSDEVIVSILLDPRFVISEKAREQGRTWLLGDIARAQAKLQDEHAGRNGATAAPEPEWDGFADDEQEPPPPQWSDDDPIAAADAPEPDDPPAAANAPEPDDPPAATWEGATTFQEPPPDRFHCTDLGNGERFIARFGANLRYCNQWKKFLTWDEKRWKLDDVQQVRTWARLTIRGIYTEVKTLTDHVKNEAEEDQKKELAKRATALLSHAVKSEHEARTNALIHNAQMDCPIQPDQLDVDPWLLNVENGTLDLRTGRLRPQRRQDLLTKIIPITYDEDAPCPLWEKFLGEVMANNDELIDFLWKAIGYSLTGDTREDCLFLLYGVGANGKSTFCNILRTMAGDYGEQAEFSTFLQRKSEAVRNDIADLRGARLVTAGETEKDKHLSESVVKQLTGRDAVKARFLFKEHFKFMPQLKIWLAANHKPVIRGRDFGIWRRIRLVPFTQTFTGPTDNKQLGEALAEELPGILAWAVRGCLAWQQDGLPMPDAVQVATDAYRKEMDVIGNFLEECCEMNPQFLVKAGDLYNAYIKWSGDKQMNPTAFGLELNDRGIGHRKYSGTVWRLGLKPTTP